MPKPFDPKRAETTLFAALLEAVRTNGAGKVILEDAERQPLAYGRLVLGSLVLGDKLRALTRRTENVGVLLPNVAGLAVVIFGLNCFGRVAAMLNFTAGLRNLRSAVATGQIRTIVTSRRFVDMAKLDEVVAGLAETEVRPGEKLAIVWLEDVRRGIGTLDKLKGLARSKLARRVHARHAMRPDQAAVLLFTSGTEGTPKGVVLTNANLVSNARQIWAHADGMLSADDVCFNPLPMFHSFGLTAGTLMPVLNGAKVVLYPSPLHYKQVPALIKATGATFLFATDTFLQGYARAAEPGDLASVRYVVAGAERVKDATRAMWAKFGTTILEGYGATECSPVLACNLPPSNTPGTVGPLLPGIEHRLEPVEGIAEGGRLVVRGPNVMAGYILADRPGVVVPPNGGWHDTGDIVTVDGRGLVAIKGRAKRFAKLGGEMVSLAAVEAMVAGLWPEANHVVVSLPDPRKGEQLVLVTEKADADRDALQREARAQGFPELWVPRAILVVQQIPVLGSGKTDFPAAQAMVQERRALL
jgi:acyl-[acyl-carrier-protein]-phospholipid O-acyltransferase/long-chain-fatty-acid--[acyl-carrier-protein] ligase